MKNSNKKFFWLPRILTIPCLIADLYLFGISIETLAGPYGLLYNIAQFLPVSLLFISIIISWKCESWGGILIFVTLLLTAIIVIFIPYLYYIFFVLMSILLIPAAILFIYRNNGNRVVLLITLAAGLSVFGFGIYANNLSLNKLQDNLIERNLNLEEIRKDVLKDLNEQ